MDKAAWYVIGRREFQSRLDRLTRIYKDDIDNATVWTDKTKDFVEAQAKRHFNDPNRKSPAVEWNNQWDKIRYVLNREYEMRIKEIRNKYENEIEKLKKEYKLKFGRITGLTAISLLAIGLLIGYIHNKRKKNKEDEEKLESEINKKYNT